ncbi:hypothetical protein PISMIDRAFT_73034, partial [Pisolithus microcarpus 441]
VFTRLEAEGPFHPPRIEAIWKAVRCGSLPPDKLKRVCNKIAEFADTFALSVKEVKPVMFMKFRLNVPKDAKFLLKVSQKPLMQAQKEWYLPVLDEFNNAGILRDIRSDEVKAVHPTVLAHWKAH